MVDRRTMRTLPKIAKRKLPGFAKLAPVVAAVDSAKHAPAWALAEGGELIACGFDLAPGVNIPGGAWPSRIDGYSVQPSRPLEPDVCVLEASRSYGSKDHGKHGDILAEAIGGALCAGSMRAGEVALVAPDEWAGNGPKPPRHQEVWAVLTRAERVLVQAHYKPRRGEPVDLGDYIAAACTALAYGRGLKYGNPIHNILDAVGLLLFAVGRIGRAGAKIKKQQPRPGPITARFTLPSGRSQTVLDVTVTEGTTPLKLNKKRFLRA